MSKQNFMEWLLDGVAVEWKMGNVEPQMNTDEHGLTKEFSREDAKRLMSGRTLVFVFSPRQQSVPSVVKSFPVTL